MPSVGGGHATGSSRARNKVPLGRLTPNDVTSLLLTMRYAGESESTIRNASTTLTVSAGTGEAQTAPRRAARPVVVAAWLALQSARLFTPPKGTQWRQLIRGPAGPDG